jgi:hypothetical protein
MLGNLFFRGQRVDVLNKLRYSEISYWNKWHEAMAKHSDDVTEQLKRDLANG